MLVRSCRRALVLASLPLLAAGAQSLDVPSEWRLTRYTVTDRLPADEITHLVEGGTGTLWAGTARGLAWFDGWIWRPIRADSAGLPPRPLGSISPSAGDSMVVVIHNLLYQGDTAGFRKVPVIINGVETQVRSAVRIRDGILALVRRNVDSLASLVLVQRGGTVPFTAPARLGTRYVPGLYPAARGGAWLNTEHGLWRWDGREWTQRFTTVGGPLTLTHLTEDPASGRGLMSVAAPAEYRGLWTWEADGAFRREASEGESAVVAAAFGARALVAVHSGGHARLREGRAWRSVNGEHPAFADARTALFDARGDLWIGSGTGLWLLRAESRLWRAHAFGFPDRRDVVNALLPMPGDSTWAGTADGITVFGPGGFARHIRSALGKSLGGVTGLARDSAGNVWVTSGASIDGALRWDGTSWRQFGARDGLRARRIHAVHTDAAGRVWFLGLSGDGDDAEPGAFVLENGRFTQWGLNEGLPSGRVYAFAEGADGDRWFGTLAGLSRWRKGQWTHWTIRQGVLRGLKYKVPFRVFAITVDDKGRPWFGAGDPGEYPYGLGTVTESDSLRFVNATQGLADDQVWGVLADPDGTVWAATEGGISAVRDGIVFSLGTARGLGFSRVWPMMLRDGVLTIGTLGGGIRELRLDDARQPPPRVLIDETVVEGQRAVVRWSAFAYRGTLPSGSVETRYRLDGGAWSDWNTGRTASFDQLRPGTHRLEVQAKGLFLPLEPVSATAIARVAPPVLLRPLVAAPLALLTAALIALGAMAARRKRENNRERTQAQAALRASEERFATAFRASPDPVAILTFPERRIIEVNQGFEEATGWSRAESVGRTCVELGLFEESAQRDRHVAELERGGKLRNAEFNLRTRHQGRRIVLVSSEVILLTGERHLLWVMSDVTEKRSLEAQLIHAQKMEAIGQLAGGVAHDFNNLLTAILGHAELLGQSLEDASDRADVQEIHRAATRAAELTGQLLTFARKRRSEPRIVNLNDLMNGTDKMLRRLLGERIRMLTEPGRELPSVRIDPGHMEQVLVNLVVNARDAMPGGGTLTVATRAVVLDAAAVVESADLAPGRYVEMTVTDTGIGIPTDLRDRIFEPFFTTKDVGKGTGLGLAICYGIAREAGGTITVSSRAGDGSTFRILLPAVESPSDAIGSSGTDIVTGGTETILLIEDELSVRSLVTRVLREAGYTVLEAGDGDEALAVLDATDRLPDLLVTDVMLPGRTGPEIAQAVRRRAPGVAVLYISGYTERATITSLAIDGPLLPKPFTRIAFLRKVREVLNQVVSPVP